MIDIKLITFKLINKNSFSDSYIGLFLNDFEMGLFKRVIGGGQDFIVEIKHGDRHDSSKNQNGGNKMKKMYSTAFEGRDLHIRTQPAKSQEGSYHHRHGN